MQERGTAIVLNPEAVPRKAMKETPASKPHAENQDIPASPSPSDEQLMLAFAQGSTDAFTELFGRYKQPIYGFFHRRLAEPTHAEELTQETFLAVLRASSRYQPRALFRTYLYAIGLKILRAHRRRTALRATLFGHQGRVPEVARPDATESGLWVRRAVEKLEAMDREILLLREFEQLSYAEIADLLKLPVNTVRSRLFRARAALRNLLKPPSSPATKDSVLAAQESAPQPIARKGERA